MVHLLERGLGFEFALDVVGQRYFVEPVEVGGQVVGRGIEGVVGVEDVEREEPGGGLGRLADDEVLRHLDAPGGVVQLGGHALEDVVGTGVGAGLIAVALSAQPERVLVGLEVGADVGRVMGPLEDVVAVVDAGFGNGGDVGMAGGEMQLAGEPAEVAGVGEDASDEGLVGGHGLAVLAGAGGAGVAAGEEAGAAGGADGALAIGVLEERAALGEAVDVGGGDEVIAVAPEGVEALLIRADPEDVGAIRHEQRSI